MCHVIIENPNYDEQWFVGYEVWNNKNKTFAQNINP
jgi:beta-lactamase class D